MPSLIGMSERSIVVVMFDLSISQQLALNIAFYVVTSDIQQATTIAERGWGAEHWARYGAHHAICFIRWGLAMRRVIWPQPPHFKVMIEIPMSHDASCCFVDYFVRFALAVEE